jgi:sugar lactone lactonase YvrE
MGKKLNIFNTKTKQNESFVLESRIGCLCLTDESDNLVLALQDGLYKFNVKTKSMTLILNRREFENDKCNHRFNDGKPDSMGRMWIGTMNHIETTENLGSGFLYSFENNKPTVRQTGITVPNGIAWSLDNSKLYFIDSPAREVYQYDFDVHTGNISNRKVIIKFIDSNERYWGFPDGMTIDKEGMLWIAHWGGACVTRWNPDKGELIEIIDVPSYQVTSVCFGSDNMDSLYITSAKVNLSEELLQKYPLSGSIFCIPNMKVQGFPSFKAKV